MSCNGCRILRKGCSETCILRPSLQLIESAEAQAHATVFVAKFFGRAALISFISAVPENQRPPLFQSLLFEAAGRTVNPVSGAVGLLSTGNWQVCQAAVETVLRGGALNPIPLFLGGGPEGADIYRLESPAAAVASRRSALTRRLSPEVATVDGMQPSDLDLSLTAGFPAKKSQLSPEKQRAGSPSMNSEGSIMTMCGDQPAPDIKLLNLFD